MVGKNELYRLPDVCPYCGAKEPELESLEVLNAYLQIESRDRVPQGFGSWSNDPDSMTSTEYRYRCCAEPLDDDEQAQLDRQLGNSRYEVVFGTKPIVKV